MEPKVLKSIRERVIKQWLQGMSRDEIAKDNDIGAGTVSSIIKDAKQEIPDIDLLREAALVLKKYDLDLSVFAPSIKLKKRQVLQHYDVTMDVLEEYKKDKPLIDYTKNLEKKLEEVVEEKNDLAE